MCKAVELLVAQNPFDATDTIVGCPRCKAVERWELLCDVDGCPGLVVRRWPSPDGYRRTCSKHDESRRPSSPGANGADQKDGGVE